MTQHTILAAIGQLPQDISVLKRALEVSQASGAGLHIVHVLDLPGQEAELEDITTFLGQASFAARNQIEVALAELCPEHSDVKIQIKLGAHALVLIDLCNDLSPKLIVMRAHQRVKISEKLLGSTTDRVIAAAQTPVLVVKGPVKNGYESVVLATNGTDDVLEASGCVCDLLPDAKLKLVQVVQIPPQLKEAMLRVGSGKGDLDAHHANLLKAARKHLRALVAKSDRHLTPKVLSGDPATVLTGLCHKEAVDLLALGQGRSNLVSRAFIGSVSRHLLRDATCDVLIWCRKTGAAS